MSRYQNRSSLRLLVFYLVIVFTLVGCAPEKPVAVKQCPGKSTAQQAIDSVRTSEAQLRAFVAYGSGHVSFYESEKDKPRNERIPTIKLWFAPPMKVRFWGDVAFNARGLDVGSNEKEFWLAAKPKEIGNVYIWGLWSGQNEAADMLLSPKVLCQGLGIIDVEDGQEWSFSPDPAGDMLTLYDGAGRIIKRLYIDNCDYRIRRIEYFDEKQAIVTALQMDDYRNVGEMFVPASIEIINPNGDGTDDTFNITLKSIKPADTIKDTVFTRPDTRGFEEIYQMINGRAVKQSGPE